MADETLISNLMAQRDLAAEDGKAIPVEELSDDPAIQQKLRAEIEERQAANLDYEIHCRVGQNGGKLTEILKVVNAVKANAQNAKRENAASPKGGKGVAPGNMTGDSCKRSRFYLPPSFSYGPLIPVTLGCLIAVGFAALLRLPWHRTATPSSVASNDLEQSKPVPPGIDVRQLAAFIRPARPITITIASESRRLKQVALDIDPEVMAKHCDVIQSLSRHYEPANKPDRAIAVDLEMDCEMCKIDARLSALLHNKTIDIRSYLSAHDRVLAIRNSLNLARRDKQIDIQKGIKPAS